MRGTYSRRETLRHFVADNVLDLLFPARCVGCGRFYSHVCPDCRGALFAIEEPFCPRCGRPGTRSSHTGWCDECVGKEFAFERARSAFVYEGVARELVTGLKFQGRRQLAAVMAELAEQAFVAAMATLESPLVTWVPAYRRAERRRGFNQAEVFAKLLVQRVAERGLSLPCACVLAKIRGTAHQQALGREERETNLDSVFVVRDSRALAGVRNVVVVDDVFTTGSTARAVARAVRGVQEVPVHVFTFARTVGGSVMRFD